MANPDSDTKRPPDDSGPPADKAEPETGALADGATDGETEAEVPIEEDTKADTADADTAPAAAEALRQLEEERDRLRAEAAQLKDRWLRAAADFENFRKRAARQEGEVQDRARMDAIRTFLPVMDNVGRALGFAQDLPGTTTIADGLRLVVKSFFDAFAQQGLQKLDALGKAFDPARHEAVGQVETADAPAGTVVQELQAGYLLKDRLLRPALVMVARPPAKPAAEPATEPPTMPEAGATAEAAPGQAADSPVPADEPKGA